MGIRNLQTYICNEVPNGYFPVDIKKEIEKWKRNNKHPDQQPIIVIDILAMIPFASAFYSDLGVSLCGGRHQFIIQKCSNFFSQLIRLGVKLVFFMDGPVQAVKYSTWYERQDEGYKNMMKIFDDVYSNLNTQEIVKRNFNKISHSMNISSLMIACAKSGEFHRSFSVECDLEIAQFATENNALAVLADDTDFLIFGGDWKYWSSKNLNHSSLTTMEYNKVALRQTLALSIRQMPLFATVGGNDIVRYDLVQQFHRQCGPYKKKFPSIAQYVRSIKNYPGNLNQQDLENISWDLFRKTNPEQTDLIVKSLESYNIASSLSDEPAITDELLSRTFNELHGYIYEVLTGITINYTILYFDFRKSDFKNYFELIEPLIKRRLGVLLQHRSDPSLRRKIVTKTSHEESYKEIDVTPEYPTIKVPALLELLYGKNEENINSIRYELLAWMITNKIKGEKLQEIPEIYLPDILVLIYLLENKQISLIEADSVLRTITDSQKGLIPVDIATPFMIDERAMRFSFLYMKFFSLIKKCLCAVGLFHLDTQFDSLHYQMIYKKYKVIPDDERDKLMEDFKDLRLFCLAFL